MNNHFEIVYEGKWTSVNDLRNNKWRSNQSLKNKMRKDYSFLILAQQPKKMGMFRVDLKYNSRLDPDNVSLKFFVDALKDTGVIIDDNKKYFKGLSITPDADLKTNSYIVRVTEVHG